MQAAGIFNIKKGTTEVAKRLGISEPTLYRYLKEIKWFTWSSESYEYIF
jgi:predicted transcriptional regulator YheO